MPHIVGHMICLSWPCSMRQRLEVKPPSSIGATSCVKNVSNNNEEIRGIYIWKWRSLVIKIEESKYFYRKYHRGQWCNGHWVFGGIERQSMLSYRSSWSNCCYPRRFHSGVNFILLGSAAQLMVTLTPYTTEYICTQSLYMRETLLIRIMRKHTPKVLKTCGWEPRGNSDVNLAHLGLDSLLIYMSSSTK